MIMVKRSRSLFASMILATGLVASSIVLVLKAETQRAETRFTQDVQIISGAVRNQLDTNEAVLGGFSAFLQAVDQSDTVATARYAEVALASYPHVYMLEVARGVPVAEQRDFETFLRRSWRPDFELKSFPSLAQQAAQPEISLDKTWPILFMYPAAASASAIYGVRLETVPHLSYALARSYESSKPLTSPVFSMYEGGQAYILMRSVNRPESQQVLRPNFFGSSMVALLLVKTDSLTNIISRANADPLIGVTVILKAAIGSVTTVVATYPGQAAWLSQTLLPLLTERVEIDSPSQPMVLQFKRQLRFQDVLDKQTFMTLLMLLALILLMPVMLIRHFRAIDRAEVEHERATHLATHDLLTSLPNRYLLADRFELAHSTWRSDGIPFAVFLIDLDHFKQINDKYGHEVGDHVLKTVAARIRNALRSDDFVALWG
jgi:CHASE1-domain containing sensor protein